MPEGLIILFVLAVIVTLVTVVGHGLWVLASAIFGVRKPVAGRDCPFCERPTPHDEPRCVHCGRQLRSALSIELEDLVAVERQLQRFGRNGTLKPETVANLWARLKRYRYALLHGQPLPQAAAPPQAAPAPPRPVEPAPVAAILVDEPTPHVPLTPPRLPITPPTSVSGPPDVRPVASLPSSAAPASVRPTVVPSKAVAAPAPHAPPHAPEPPRVPTPPLAAAIAPARSAPPPPPRRAWSEVLAGFMEERNIRWGEVVGGLLMVGSSAALVASLWDQLGAIPYFPFLLFVAITASIFGIGLYSHHRWKLESTSHGMLIIATLLVPLNFVAMAALSRSGWDAITLGMGFGGLVLFVWLTALAGSVIAPTTRWLQTLAVVGCSAALLAASRWLDAQSGAILQIGAAAVPSLLFAVATLGAIVQPGFRRRLTMPRTIELFVLLGTASFALIVTHGMMAKLSGDVQPFLQRLSPLLAIGGGVALAVSLTVVRGTRRSADLAPWHTAGLTLTFVTAAIMLGAVVLGWPHPLAMIIVGAINAAVLGFAALRWRMPVLHGAAMACATVVYLCVFHCLYSGVPWINAGTAGIDMLRLLLDSSSGTAMVGLFLLFGLASEGLARRFGRSHAAWYAGGAAVMAVLGLMLVTTHALQPKATAVAALRAAILYAIYGAGALALAVRWRRAEPVGVGLCLVAIAPLWALRWHPATHTIDALWAAVLAGEGLLSAALGSLLAYRTGDRPLRALFGRPLLMLAEGLAAAAAGVALYTVFTQWAAIDREPWLVVALAAFTAAYMLLAWHWQSAERTWIASIALMVGLVHTLAYNYSVDWIAQPWMTALLLHATLAVIGAATLGRLASPKPLSQGPSTVYTTLVVPLELSALISSALCLPLLAWAAWDHLLALAGCMAWLAAIWLVLALRQRSHSLFAWHQAVLTLTAALAAAAWIERGDGFGGTLAEWWSPRSLHAFGGAVGLLSLAWVVVRLATRVLAPPNRTTLDETSVPVQQSAWHELLAVRPSVDWFVRHATVVAALALSAVYLMPAVGDELFGVGVVRGWFAANQQQALGGGLWLVLLVLAVVLATALFDRFGRFELLSSIFVAMTVPYAIAAPAAADVAAASALRWALAAVFLPIAVLVWNRHRLLPLAQAAGMRLELDRSAPALARTALVVTGALPVVILTLEAAWVQLSGNSLGGPAAGSFFDRLGPANSYLLPLIVVIGGLVGFALRERSSRYAFGGGLVATLAVMLGYALYVTTIAGKGFGIEEVATLLQLATISTAAWAIAWLAARIYVDVWREARGRPLMLVQLGFGTTGNLLLVGSGLLALVVMGDWLHEWTAAVGSPLGWIALLLAAGAIVFRQVQLDRRPRPDTIGFVGLTLMAMIAMSVERYSPGWGYRTLMLGWASYALLIVAASWWAVTIRALPDAHGPSQAILRMAARWVRTAGLLAVALGIKAAMFHGAEEERLWAAAAIAIASIAGATMAVWRRQEAWAFAAALGVNLAASLVVGYGYRQLTFDEWWLQLVQANAIASAVVALAWLAVRRRLYELRELNLRSSPLLALQCALPVACNLALMAARVGWLVARPTDLPAQVANMSSPLGWIALTATAAAVAWYLATGYGHQMIHVVAGLAVGLGVLTAGLVDASATPAGASLWAGYQTLTIGWAVAALAVLAIGWAMHRYDAAVVGLSGRSFAPTPLAVENWVVVIALAAAMLAGLYAHRNVAGVWWNIATLTAGAAACGGLAMWLRRPAYAFLSGVLINGGATVAWLAWRPETDAALAAVHYNVIGLAIGSLAWSLVGRLSRRGAPPLMIADHLVSFSDVAARLAVAILGLVSLYRMVHVLAGNGLILAAPVEWIALGAVGVALLPLFWDRTSRFALAGLYGVLLWAVVTQITSRTPDALLFCWKSVCTFTGFMIVAALIGWALPKARPLWRTLQLDDERDPWGGAWFHVAQALIGLTTAALTVWVAIDFRFDGVGEEFAVLGMTGRLTAMFAALMLLGASMLMAWQSDDRWLRPWQYAAMASGVLLSSTFGWARLRSLPGTPSGDAPWLHRCALLMISSAMMTLMSSLGLAKTLPQQSTWPEAGRRAAPVFAVVALAMLALVLGQEVWAFAIGERLLVADWAIIVVAVALVGLAAGGIIVAVSPQLEPLRLSERGRTVYVYAAEILLALVGLHVWLTKPEWFALGVVRQYWMLIAMTVAFAGAGLAEFFKRRSMPVLAEPLANTALLLPAVPAIAFWFMPQAMAETLFLGGQSPVVWLLMGVFYGALAVRRGSIPLAALALVTGNTGLWVLWHRLGWQFLDRPQLWLIPIALCALVAEHFDRRRLSDAQRTALRYVALAVIYVSSTTEFWRAIGDTPRLALVLALVTIGLSVIGILAGILLRVRSFLYLGVTFLVIVLGRIIFFAAFKEGHMWVFWSCCLLLGAAIIALFAVFEKRRNDVLLAVERFKAWHE